MILPDKELCLRIQTRGHRQWQFGRFEIRARIDTARGAWPAILANFAWGTEQPNVGKWDDLKKPLADFTANDPDWTKKFHIWRMDWNNDSISLFLDDQLLNSTLLNQTINPDGFNPFHQPHYILLNLALGGNGGDPAKTLFPIKYEVDYVRVYQDK
jgi:beta-glucanase (GH16 family)